MISMELLIVLIIITLVAIVITYRILKGMEKQMKSYEDEGVTVEEERERSLRYETESFKKHLPIQIFLYILLFIITVIGFVIFLL
ncbi:MAG TPA: hypothetical protein VK144_09075 [Bacillota bacterium]|nr:hypothetical protein [Bacillota bacterium]